MVSKHLHQNDTVRVLENLFDPLSLHLSVTADSIGRIISFEEYCDYIKRKFDGKDTLADRQKHFSRVAKDLQDDKAFLVRIERFAPVSHSADLCILEDITVIGDEYLEKVEE